jgi:hypothetical protein
VVRVIPVSQQLLTLLRRDRVPQWFAVVRLLVDNAHTAQGHGLLRVHRKALHIHHQATHWRAHHLIYTQWHFTSHL